MTIEKKQDGSKLYVMVEGRLETSTAPQLEAELKGTLDGVTDLTVDFEKLQYISSAGLRVLLMAQKLMNKQGSMVIKNANDDIMEVFDLTGFSNVLNVE